MRKSPCHSATWLALLLGLCVADAAAAQETVSAAPKLALPIACEPGKTCFIQSYVDTDPGSGIVDYACGSASQDNHKGTDFRVLSISAADKGVPVLAAADGRVKAVRDGMADVLLADGDKARVADRECGNGVLLDHGHGWETQYCHLGRGSVSVKEGDTVVAGSMLGHVGVSGLAQFAHVHFEVRHNGMAIDPFSGRGRDAACERQPQNTHGLWDEKASKAFPYANGEIFEAHFTSRVPVLEELETTGLGDAPLRTSEQLVYAVRFTNLRRGDRVRLIVNGPDGFKVESTTDPLDRNKATYLAYAGKRLTKPLWAAGRYGGLAQLLRGGVVAKEGRSELQLGP